MGIIKEFIKRTGVRDLMTSGLAQLFANKYLGGIGEISLLKVDTATKRLSADVLLKGETSPIKISVNYALNEEGGKLFILLNDLQSSREWMKLLFDRQFVGKQFEIPEKFAGGVRMALK